MDKLTYQAKYKELFNEKHKITEQLKELDEQYIEANKPCNIGDIVEAEGREGKRQNAVVVNFIVGSSGNIEPILRKAKKDGSASHHKIYFWEAEIIHYPEKSSV